MDENENAFLLLLALYTRCLVMAATTAIQLFMCTYCTHVFMQSSAEVRRKRRLYIGFSLAICFFDSFRAFSEMNYTFTMFMGPKTLPELLNLQEELLRTWFTAAQSWADDLVIMIGDGLLIYRCFIVWTSQCMLTALLIALYVVFIALIVWAEIASISTGRWFKALGEAIFSLSAAVNCTVTFLIGGKLLQTYRRNTKSQVTSDLKTYFGVISIVAESALPFALASIFYAVCYNQSGSDPSSHQAWKISENISLTLWKIISVLSPQLIIWRVTLGRSLAHSTDEAVMSPLAFNNRNQPWSQASDLEGASSFGMRNVSRSEQVESTRNGQTIVEAMRSEKGCDSA